MSMTRTINRTKINAKKNVWKWYVCYKRITEGKEKLKVRCSLIRKHNLITNTIKFKWLEISYDEYRQFSGMLR